MNAVLKFKKEKKQKQVPKAFFGTALNMLIGAPVKSALWDGVKGTWRGGAAEGWRSFKRNVKGTAQVAKAVAKAAVTPETPVTNNPPSTQSVAPKNPVLKPNYAANFAGMNFTDAEKKFITDAGYNPDNPRSVLDFILKQAPEANLGAKGGAGIADGYWGDKSTAAFNALRNRGVFNASEPIVDAPEIIPVPQPEPLPPVDAPDFGYESTGDYAHSNMGWLKTNDIGNYDSMLNYIRNNQNSSFALDMMHLFGTDLSTWNKKDIEKTMGIGGHYGRIDRSRIQGFMAGKQATWRDLRYAKMNEYLNKLPSVNNQGTATLGNTTPGMNRE